MRQTKRHPTIRPSHPGEVIADALVSVAMSKTAFAMALGVSRQTLYDILDQRQGVSASMAVRLEAVLGSSAEFWLDLQAARDLWSARRSVDIGSLRRIPMEA